MMDGGRHLGLATLENVVGITESCGIVIMSVQLGVAKFLEVCLVLRVHTANEAGEERHLLGLLAVIVGGWIIAVVGSHGG